MNRCRICDVLVIILLKTVRHNHRTKCQCLVRCVLDSPASCICGGTHSGVHDLPPSKSQTTKGRRISAWLRRLHGIRLVETAAVGRVLSTREVRTVQQPGTRREQFGDMITRRQPVVDDDSRRSQLCFLLYAEAWWWQHFWLPTHASRPEEDFSGLSRVQS